VLQPLYVFILWISLKTVGVFQPKNYKVGRSLADNYKSRQNTADPNISRIFGSAGFFLFKNSARKSTMGQLVRYCFMNVIRTLQTLNQPRLRCV